MVLLIASGWTGYGRWQERGAFVDAMRTGEGQRAAMQLDFASSQLELVKSTVADTYDGPDLKNFNGMRVAWADELGYCIQVVVGSHTYSKQGPGGRPAAGACPYKR